MICLWGMLEKYYSPTEIHKHNMWQKERQHDIEQKWQVGAFHTYKIYTKKKKK